MKVVFVIRILLLFGVTVAWYLHLNKEKVINVSNKVLIIMEQYAGMK